MAKRNRKTGASGMISTGPVAENRRAKFDYEILDTVEAGIVLTGTEVKSLRRGKAQITDSYASPEEGEIWLINAFIPELAEANRFNHFERRKRKLLLNKREVNKLSGAVQKEGNTLVPLRLYFNDRGIAKLLLGLGKGKKQFDKRETQKQRDWNRQKQRLLKDHG